jgi:hypothetical protein
MLAALSNKAKAVVGEVFKAVGTALDEFHFAVEAFTRFLNCAISPFSPSTASGLIPCFSNNAFEAFANTYQEAASEL